MENLPPSKTKPMGIIADGKKGSISIMCPDCYMSFKTVPNLRLHQQRLCPGTIKARDENQQMDPTLGKHDFAHHSKFVRFKLKQSDEIPLIKMNDFVNMRKREIEDLEQLHQVRMAELRNRGGQLADEKMKLAKEMKCFGVPPTMPPPSNSPPPPPAPKSLPSGGFKPGVNTPVTRAVSRVSGASSNERSPFIPQSQIITTNQLQKAELEQQRQIFRLRETLKKIERADKPFKPPTPPLIPNAWLPDPVTSSVDMLLAQYRANGTRDVFTTHSMDPTMIQPYDSVAFSAIANGGAGLTDEIRAYRQGYIRSSGQNHQVLADLARLEASAAENELWLSLQDKKEMEKRKRKKQRCKERKRQMMDLYDSVQTSLGSPTLFDQPEHKLLPRKRNVTFLLPKSTSEMQKHGIEVALANLNISQKLDESLKKKIPLSPSPSQL